MSRAERAAVIDAHHHLWRYDAQEFGWLTGPLGGLRRDFLLGDLIPALHDARVDGTVVVQARQSMTETAWLLKQAAETPQILGVVGWAPIAGENFSETLDGLRRHSALKGLRHVVQAEPDPDFLMGEGFNRGMGLLWDAGLVYDLLVLDRQLPQAVQFVDRHPRQVFVLDHLAKPGIAAGEMEPWASDLRALAERPNVFCKLSGMVTEAKPLDWTPADLVPYLDVAVEAFGPERLLAGSDWPVCLAASGYAQWFNVLREFFSGYTASEQAGIFGGNAARVYHLDVNRDQEEPC